MAALPTDPLAGIEPKPHPDPNPLWQRRIKSIPRSEIPPKIGNMDITEELLDDYKGHEVFLKERAKHPPHCYKAYDALRLCLIQRIDPVTCGRVVEAYRPCAKELQRAKVARMLELDEERRKLLAVKAREMEQHAHQMQLQPPAGASSLGSGSGTGDR